MAVVFDSRFLTGVVVGVVGIYVFHKFVKPVPGKGQ